MAVIPYDIVKAKMTFTEGEPPIFYVPEGNSQSFRKGEIVTITGGYCVEVTVAAAGNIYGVAAADASNDAAAQTKGIMVPVFVALQSTVFEANMKTGAGADYVSLATDVGKYMAFYHDTANSKVCLNAASTTTALFAKVFIHGFGADSRVGDTNARMLFTFVPATALSTATPAATAEEPAPEEKPEASALVGPEGHPAREERPGEKPGDKPADKPASHEGHHVREDKPAERPSHR